MNSYINIYSILDDYELSDENIDKLHKSKKTKINKLPISKPPNSKPQNSKSPISKLPNSKPPISKLPNSKSQNFKPLNYKPSISKSQNFKLGEVSLEFINSKPTNSNEHNSIQKKILQVHSQHSFVKNYKHIYNEFDNLPINITDAIIKKQNLTLKQILVLMNLHAIPGLVMNIIHENLQVKLKRRQIKIFHDSRIFYVSQYNWYDLNQIEKMIDDLMFLY